MHDGGARVYPNEQSGAPETCLHPGGLGIARRPSLGVTYQAAPRQGSTRKRMQYLRDGGSPGDTAFNVWPVPLVLVANVEKVTRASHDTVVEHRSAADDSEAEDGAGTAVAQDLGDNVSPFLREWNEQSAKA